MLTHSDSIIADRYEVLKTLRGGMGVVFLCRDRVDDLPVALKTFRPEYLPDRAARDRFLREGTVWVEIGDSPHIVKAYRVERTDQARAVYIVMELVAAPENMRDASLRSWLAPGRALPAQTALLFALHVARGMKNATAKIESLVHRDLKPENVLVGRDGLARVTDFGLASVVEANDAAAGGTEPSAAEVTRCRTYLTAGVAGTPQYMAPEQWGGERPDARADIYSFGCIVYEMLVGVPVNKGRTLEEMKRAAQSGLSVSLPPGLPGELSTLVRRCLAVEREGRYATWAEAEANVAEAYELTGGRACEDAAVIPGHVERVALAWSYNAIGLSYYDISKFGAAARYFETVLRLGRETAEAELEAAGTGNLGVAYHALGDLRRAAYLFEQQLTLARRSHDRSREGKAAGNLALVLLDLNEPARAEELLGQALTAARETNNKADEGTCLGGLANAQRRLGNIPRAIEYHLRHLEISRELQNRAEEGRVLGNLGNAYDDMGDHRRAVEFYRQSLAVKKQIGDTMGEALTSFNLALSLSRQGMSREALRSAEHAAQLFTLVGNSYYAAHVRQLTTHLQRELAGGSE